MIPIQLVGIVSNLGLGEQITVAATLGVILIYLFRGKKIAGSIAGLIGTVWFAAMSAGVVLLIAIFTGWIDPNVSKFFGDITTVAKTLLEVPFEMLIDAIRSNVGSFR